MRIITKKEARELSLIRYFTGKPCKRGHISERNVNQGHCCECNLLHGRSFDKKFPEKKAERWANYSKKNPLKMKAKNRREHLRLKEKFNGKIPARGTAEKRRERSKRYSFENKKLLSKKNKEWRERNPEKHNAKEAKRRSLKLKATPAWVNYRYITLFYAAAKMEEIRTGRKVHVDHIVPLKGKNVCGLHCEDNLQLLFASANLSKGNRF